MLDTGFVIQYGNFWAMLVLNSMRQSVNMTEEIKNAIPNGLYGIALHGENCVSVKKKFPVFFVLN